MRGGEGAVGFGWRWRSFPYEFTLSSLGELTTDSCRWGAVSVETGIGGLTEIGYEV